MTKLASQNAARKASQKKWQPWTTRITHCTAMSDSPLHKHMWHCIVLLSNISDLHHLSIMVQEGQPDLLESQLEDT